MAQDLVKSGVELPALMTAGRWKSAKMPARYTERQAGGPGRGSQVLPEERGLNFNYLSSLTTREGIVQPRGKISLSPESVFLE